MKSRLWVSTRRLNILLMLAVLSALPNMASAQIPGLDYERVLFPVVIHAPVPGAYGSLWDSTVWLRNRTKENVAVFPITRCTFGICVPGPLDLTVPDNVTFQPSLVAGRSDVPGSLLYVDKRYAKDLQFELRIHDLSRQAETWGTEVPVIRESEAYVETLDLFPVPVTEGFRSHLRVYGFDPTDSAPMRVRIYGIDPAELINSRFQVDRLVHDFTANFHVTEPSQHGPYPAYFEVPNVADFAAGESLLRIELEPLGETTRFWAFVAVTNNATQHVTLITPH